MTNKKRTEFDTLGSKLIDKNRHWGAQTQRSIENFQIGEEKMPIEIIRSIGLQKKAAAQANLYFKIIDQKIGKAIIKTCDQIINLKLKDEFPISVWQTGSGTHTNMNANEVISNYSIKILKGKIGTKHPVHPNDHVNLSQSSNDTFPTVMHIAINELTEEKLLPSLKNLINEIRKKSIKYKSIIKIGRTHLQDATPLTLGQEFSGYLNQISNCLKRIQIAKKELNLVAQGGTAVGTGINSPKNFDTKFCNFLNKMTINNYKPSPNKFESIASHDALLNFSSSLNNLSTAVYKIINDIRFLASGPRAGLAEINLPANEPGSSIMPGKINPTQIEALAMVCCQVFGNNHSVHFAGSQGHFELNTYKPIIAYNIIQSINLLSNGINSFNKNCLKKIKPNMKNIEKNLKSSLMLVTALNKHIGYDNAAKIAKKAFNENLTLKQAAIKLNLVDEKMFDKLINPKKMI